MAKKEPPESSTEPTQKSRPSPPLSPKASGKPLARSGKSIARSSKSIAQKPKGKSVASKSLAHKAQKLPAAEQGEPPVESIQVETEQVAGPAEVPENKAPPSGTPGPAAGARARMSRPPPPPRPGPAEEEEMIEALIQAVRVPAGGRFETRDEIGRGGVGAVRVAFDRMLQRRTAMKKLLDSVRAQPLMVRSFIREAQITAQLDHPNLVPVHDMGIDEDGRLFFIMKLVEGRTLSQLIEDYKEGDHHIDLAYELLINMLDVLIKVCDGLSFAHSRGVIHCDIKAQNIMVGDYGQVYLMDWGFAQLLPTPAEPPKDSRGVAIRRVEDPLPKLPAAATSGYVFGTPGYMSPEQAQGLTDKLDERTDVFSLGALLYQILSGDVPYRADTPAETVLLAQRCKFPLLEAESVGLYSLRPKELVRIAMKAMEKRPEDRYQSVEAFKADLVHYLRGGGHFPTRTVVAGAHIIREGEDADAAFIIASGQCEVYKTVGNKKVVLQVLKAGEVFGEMALLTSTPRSASVVALTDVKLMVVTREVIDQEMSTMKPWMGAFVRSLANRFRDVQEQSMMRKDGEDSSVPLANLPEGRRPWWKFW